MKTTVKAQLLRSSLLQVLGGVAVNALFLSGAAWAQQTPATTTVQTTPPTEAEPSSEAVIVITGSRLRQETFTNPNPTFEVGSAEVEATQVTNLADLIDDLPVLGIGTNNRGTQVQNGDSFAFPDVLDLGTQRTLTLVNGRRVIASNPGSVFVPGNASGSQVDLSSFNPQIIQRVDVLAGTGGAIYGADAVGGVVNLITKDEFEGLDLRVQGGTTTVGGGDSFRASTTWGSNFNEDRGNIILSADFMKQEYIGASADSAVRYGGSGIANSYEGSIRRGDAFNAQSGVSTLLGGGALPTAFLPQASDGVRATFFGPLSIANPLTSVGGTLLTGQILGAGFATNTNLLPATPIAGALARPGADPQGFAFFAPSSLPAGVNPMNVINTLAPGTNTAGLSTAQQTSLALALLQRNRPTPQEYFAANPGLDPRLFLGTFGAYNPTTGALNATNGYLPTIPNTNPATSAIFPRIAVPLTFDAGGNLVAYNPGALSPTLQGRLGSQYGGEGYDAAALGHTQLQAGTERLSLSAMGKYDISDSLRYRSMLMYSNMEFEQSGGAITNSSSGSAQGGGLGVPIYIDQNPYFNAASRATVNNLVAQGMTVPTVGGQRVMYMGRAFTDLLGGGQKSTFKVENFQINQSLEGDFNVANIDFYWDVAAGYGRSEQTSKRPDFLDLEFALAIDVVNGPNGPVCRQQTLANPEPITVRNPGTASVVTTVGLTPTRDQVAACVPLNLFGNGAPSAGARDYVTGDANVHALNTLEYYSGSVGADVLQLPGGEFKVGLQGEFRRESAEFEPSSDTQIGAGRTAPQGRGQGSLEFKEYGVEAVLPIFGQDFQFPGFREFDLSYALRIVERDQDSSTVAFSGSGTKDDTFNYSFRWKPIDDLTLRGAKSRTVRSASLVELVGPFTVAFTTLAAGDNPCTTTTIGQGPNPAVRRANCITAVQRLGIAGNATDAATFLSTFIGTAGTRPANAGGNPGLSNEEANTYTLGATYEPSFIPNLVFAIDYFNVDLKNEIGLVGPGTFTGACFDSVDFPNTIVGGARACEAFLYGTPTGPGGQYVIPATNALTGNPGIAGVLTGSPGVAQAPFEFAFAAFSNLNLGAREFRGLNMETRYNFNLGDVPFIGGAMSNWGDIFLRASYFETQRYDIYGDGVTLTDRLAGEHTNPENEVRFDFRHRIGPFDHTLQTMWNSATVTNVLTDKTLFAEQTPSFFADDFYFFNYFASYNVSDNVQLRLSINNLFNTDEPRNRYGLPNQFDGGLGREIIVGASARF